MYQDYVEPNFDWFSCILIWIWRPFPAVRWNILAMSSYINWEISDNVPQNDDHLDPNPELVFTCTVWPYSEYQHSSMSTLLTGRRKAHSDDSCHLYSPIVPSIHFVPFNSSYSKRNWAKFGTDPSPALNWSMVGTSLSSWGMWLQVSMVRGKKEYL
jgi:hypothetical protein